LEARAGDADELAEPLDDGTLLLLDGEKEERHTAVLSDVRATSGRPRE
jgi:hypothetical protein